MTMKQSLLILRRFDRRCRDITNSLQFEEKIIPQIITFGYQGVLNRYLAIFRKKNIDTDMATLFE